MFFYSSPFRVDVRGRDTPEEEERDVPQSTDLAASAHKDQYTSVDAVGPQGAARVLRVSGRGAATCRREEPSAICRTLGQPGPATWITGPADGASGAVSDGGGNVSRRATIYNPTRGLSSL